MLCYVFYTVTFLFLYPYHRVKFVVGAIKMAWMEPRGWNHNDAECR